MHVTEQEEIDRIEVMNSLRVVRLDAQNFKHTIRPSPIACLNAIREFLPIFAYEKLDKLCE